METGTITRVVVERGFGFVRPDSGDRRDVFFHATVLAGGLFFDSQLEQKRVTFERETQADGRQRAKNVRAA